MQNRVLVNVAIAADKAAAERRPLLLLDVAPGVVDN
jgi:hypothetical protein